MEKDLKVRKVTQDVVMFVWFKHQIISEEPLPKLSFTPEITPQIMNNFRKAVWMQSLINDFIWRGFFEKHFQRMTSSSELFTQYVSYACYIFNEKIRSEEQDRIFGTLSIVIYFVLRCREAGSEVFLNTCVELFCAFFEKEIRTKFEGQGGWEKFNAKIEELQFRDFHPAIDANIRSFKHLNQQRGARIRIHMYRLTSKALEKFTQDEVETYEKAVTFTESVAGKMGELCQKTFGELLANFAQTDSQVEELYRQTVGEASGGSAREVKYFSLQKFQEALENIYSETKSETKEPVEHIVTTSDPLDTQNSDINFPKFDAPNKSSSNLSPK